MDEYNAHRLAYVNAAADEKLVSLELLRDFVHNTVLENLAANIHKEFAAYFHPDEKQHFLLLGHRKIYSTDKNVIQRVELNAERTKLRRKKQRLEQLYLQLQLSLLQKINLFR